MLQIPQSFLRECVLLIRAAGLITAQKCDDILRMIFTNVLQWACLSAPLLSLN